MRRIKHRLPVMREAAMPIKRDHLINNVYVVGKSLSYKNLTLLILIITHLISVTEITLLPCAPGSLERQQYSRALIFVSNGILGKPGQETEHNLLPYFPTYGLGWCLPGKLRKYLAKKFRKCALSSYCEGTS